MDAVAKKVKIMSTNIRRIIRRDKPPGVLAIRSIVRATILPVIHKTNLSKH